MYHISQYSLKLKQFRVRFVIPASYKQIMQKEVNHVNRAKIHAIIRSNSNKTGDKLAWNLELSK